MLSTCCIADIIERKRDGHVLTHEEIQSLVTAACDGTAEPAQLGKLQIHFIVFLSCYTIMYTC